MIALEFGNFTCNTRTMDYYTDSNHFIGRRIGRGLGTTAHWSKGVPDTLIVFIHGFSGTAEGTWFDVTSELRSDADFASTDILFVGYDSTKSRALISARLIGRVLRDFVTSPDVQANTHLYFTRQRPKFQYRKVLVVCHSLGAALMRRIAVDFAREQSQDLNNIELVLFAPAHKGASLHSLSEDIITRGLGGGLLAWCRNIFNFKKQVLLDLSPGCEYITALEKDTISEISQRGKLSLLIAKSTYFGVYENIVEVADFAQDSIFETLDDEDHTTLVKTSKQGSYVLQACKDFIS